MNLSPVTSFAASVVIAAAVTGQIDRLQRWIWIAQAKIIYESRASNWGSPRYLSHTKERRDQASLKSKDKKQNNH